MKKSVRVLGLSLAVMLAASSLFGCQGKSGDNKTAGETGTQAQTEAKTDGKADEQKQTEAASSEVVEIEYLNHKSESEAIDAMDELIRKFNEANPGIKVTQTTTPDFATVITTRAQTNEMPDVFSCTTNNSYEIMFRDGLIMDLTGQEFLNNVEAETLTLSEYEGKNWRMPYSLSCYGIYIRTDIFEENGLEIPETYEELMAAAAALSDKGITPFVCANKDMGVVGQRMERLMGIIDADCNEEFKKIADGSLAPEDSDILKTYAAAEHDIAKYTTEDSLGVDQTSSYQNFVNDGGAMLINGTWTLVTLKDYNPDIKVVMIPFPNPTGDETEVPISIDTSFCIAESTPNKDACLKFLEFLSNSENAQIYTDYEGSPNVVKGVNYGVEEFQAITEKMDKGEIFVSLNAVWPSGLRNDMRDYAQSLIMDGDENAFIEAVGTVIKDVYNK